MSKTKICRLRLVNNRRIDYYLYVNELCGRCFKALGVESRFKIYQYLEKSGEKSVSEITRHIKLRQPTVSYHLKAMLSSGILKKREVGKEVYYSVSELCPYKNEKCVVSHYAENI